MTLPNITQHTKLPLLNRAIEQGRNAAMLHLGIDPTRAAEAIVRDAQEFEPILTAYAQRVAAIMADPDLSQEGKQKRLDKALGDITTALAKMDKTASIEEVCKTCEALVFSAVKQELDKHKPQDAMLDYLQASEMRQYLHRHREEAHRQFGVWLAEQERAGVAIPDQMRTFSDPVEHLFLESCRGYSKERDQLYRAITGAPFPVELLPPDTIQKGRALLEAKVAPTQVENLALARARQTMYASLWESALKLAEKPETLQPYHEPRQILSDEQRASQASAGGH